MIETDEVINRPLYFVLDKLLGPARVVNHGQFNEIYHQEEVGYIGKRLRIVTRGETYVVCCPFCNDTRHRMAVNYSCGVYDPDVEIPRGDGTNYRWHNWELWKCYNEECQSNKEHRDKFRLEIGGAIEDCQRHKAGSGLRDPFAAQVEARTRPKPVLQECEFPGLLVPLHELPTDHPAVTYLRGRGFDPAALSEQWKVGYAVSVPARIREAMSQGRIIVPVRRDGATVGWQARFVGDLNWKVAGVAKYLTYFPKSLTIYGIDEADKAPIVTLVEGVTDVWRYGYGAVCGLGKTLSQPQAVLLAERLKGRPLVLVPDRDDPESEINFFRSASLVKSMGYTGPIGVAALPAGRDPADLSSAELRYIVKVSVPGLQAV